MHTKSLKMSASCKQRDRHMKGKAYIGVSFLGLLTIAFIVLKLTKVINWSWIWVLSPLWIEVLVGLIIIYIVLRGTR